MAAERGVLSRLGLVLLNLLGPGLGLLGLGRWALALAFFSLSLLVQLFLLFGPPVPFTTLITIVCIGLLTLFAAMWVTWRKSRVRQADRNWYSRWYSVVAACACVVALSLFIERDGFRYRGFYIPSVATEPTLIKGDRLIAYMGPLGQLRRGDLVLVRTPRGAMYVKRVAAFGGERFGMKSGIIFLNGAPVPQRHIRNENVQTPLGTEEAQRFKEEFPGEHQAHEIYDLGPSSADDVPEMTIPPNAVFLLGDNRDLSADSRIPVEMGGLGGPMQISAIAGRPSYMSWGSSRPIGAKLDR